LEANGTVEEHLLEGLSRALWGNRIDLSFAASMAHGTVVNTDDLIVDDSAFAVTQILRGQGLIHLIADNAGTELTMDLALIDTLLETTTATVMLHVKMHPTFVSDAIPADVWNFFATLEERGGLFADFGERLQKAFEQKRFFILPHMFWNSPYSMWQMPSQLKELLDQGRILIVKGDANYRRLLGDAVWPTHTAFADVVSYFKAPVLALRTLKSDPIIGLPHGLPTRLEEINPEWRINGKHGVIQFKA